MLTHVNFNTEEQVLRDLAYNDIVYAWLLIHSHYKPEEKHNFIYKSEFTFKGIGKEIQRNEKTVSSRFKSLKEQGIIRECNYQGKKVYKMSYYDQFEELDSETVYQLISLPVKDTREELIKTYAYLLKKKRESIREGKRNFTCSSNEIILAFGYSTGHTQTFDRMKFILTVLQGAGIIKFRTILPRQDEKGQWTGKQMEVYEVNQRASDEWLGSRPNSWEDKVEQQLDK